MCLPLYGWVWVVTLDKKHICHGGTYHYWEYLVFVFYNTIQVQYFVTSSCSWKGGRTPRRHQQVAVYNANIHDKTKQPGFLYDHLPPCTELTAQHNQQETMMYLLARCYLI